MRDLTSFGEESARMRAQRCVIVNEQRFPSQQRDGHHTRGNLCIVTIFGMDLEA